MEELIHLSRVESLRSTLVELGQSRVWVHLFVNFAKTFFDSSRQDSKKAHTISGLCHQRPQWDPHQATPRWPTKLTLVDHVSLAFLSRPQTLRQVPLQAHARERAQLGRPLRPLARPRLRRPRRVRAQSVRRLLSLFSRRRCQFLFFCGRKGTSTIHVLSQ